MPASTLRRLLRPLGVLLACLGLAAVSLAASGGAQDPGEKVAAAARGHVGEAYAWGASGPTSWDCSGLTSTLWREVGGVRGVPRTSRDQQAWAVPIPAEQALPGDLVFFGEPVNHVGVVLTRTTTSRGTTVRMVDASSSQKGVVERQVWTTGVVRYGRVPRPGMPAVTPWQPPATPAPTGTPKPTAKPTPSPKPSAAPSGQRSTVLGSGAGRPVSPVARKAADLARRLVGDTTYTDTELVRAVWSRAGGRSLPTGRAALSAAGRLVPLHDARVGDLVVYGAPGEHVGIYLGGGVMVDASRSLGKVVQRAVWASPTLQVVRLPV